MRIFLYLILIVAIQVSLKAQTGLTPEDVASIKSINFSKVSPDGNWIAFTESVPEDPRVANAYASAKLHLYNVKTGNSIPFITRGMIGSVQFRPGYSSLTFLSRREDGEPVSIYEISLEGGEAQVIYQFERSISSYSWSPDGKVLVFNSRDKSEVISELPYKPEIYEEFDPMTSAYLVNVAGEGTPEKIAEGNAYQSAISPDGKFIAVSVAPTAWVDDSYVRQKIHVVDINTRKSLATIEHEGKLGKFTWSPDSKKLAFIGGADINDPIAGRLFIANAGNGKTTRLLPDFQGKFESVSWASKDELKVLVSEGVYSTFAQMGVNGKNLKRIIDKMPAQIGSFSSSENLTSMIISKPEHPFELYMLDAGNKTPKRITDSNPWLKERKLGKQEIVEFKTKDGFTIQGMLVLPLENMVKGNSIPMIVNVHGGPESHYLNGWLTSYSNPGQMGAAQGYAVYYPNYRGSTGRGESFAKSSQGDPAGKEFDDIIEGMDYLIKNKGIDGNRIGVTGGSYGGYATAWMSTRHSERFAAGVMSVGISDNISKWGTSDIPEEMYHVHSRKRIWEDYQFFLERSPIYYADQAKTPLLIMHGKNDTRVNPGQSYELYRHIKTRTDTPVRLILYPGEGHGNRRATARYDYSLRMLRWFDNYLLNKGSNLPETRIEIK